MKKFYSFLTGLGLMYSASAQTTSTFEEMTLAPNSYYNGDDFSGGMNSGNAFFYNYYDTTWGAAYGYWAEGWAISNKFDTITQPSDYLTQLFSAKEVNDMVEPNFAVGTQGSRIVLTGSAIGKSLGGFDITNSTYAYNSIKLGDMFGKKFGGASGNDPDYFKLVVRKYLGGVLSTDSVEFYLADYRFADNSQDYIVKEWTHVNLSSLGDVDSLEFTLRSSDVGGSGINTPVYFCIDNFVTNNSPTSVAENVTGTKLSVYPNPCANMLTIETGEQESTYLVMDINGKVLLNGRFDRWTKIDMTTLPAGVYSVRANDKTVKFVKE